MKKSIHVLIIILLMLGSCKKTECENNFKEGVYYSDNQQLIGWEFEMVGKKYNSYFNGAIQASNTYILNCGEICFDGVCDKFNYNGDTLKFENSNYNLILK